ncbi:MAG: hypothetical protein GF418_15995 [Chitinivibrionales bacterium]|nr:hypothetical protein [Chitinivibrionales bacterium]
MTSYDTNAAVKIMQEFTEDTFPEAVTGIRELLASINDKAEIGRQDVRDIVIAYGGLWSKVADYLVKKTAETAIGVYDEHERDDTPLTDERRHALMERIQDGVYGDDEWLYKDATTNTEEVARFDPIEKVETYCVILVARGLPQGSGTPGQPPTEPKASNTDDLSDDFTEEQEKYLECVERLVGSDGGAYRNILRSVRDIHPAPNGVDALEETVVQCMHLAGRQAAFAMLEAAEDTLADVLCDGGPLIPEIMNSDEHREWITEMMHAIETGIAAAGNPAGVSFIKSPVVRHTVLCMDVIRLATQRDHRPILHTMVDNWHNREEHARAAIDEEIRQLIERLGMRPPTDGDQQGKRE